MYSILNYVPAVLGLIMILYLMFKNQSGNEGTLLWYVMVLIGIGIISSYVRNEMFIRDLDAAAHMPLEVVISVMRAIWMPTLIAFLCCFIIIGVARYKKKQLHT